MGFQKCMLEIAASAAAIHVDIVERLATISSVEVRQQMRIVFNHFIKSLQSLFTTGLQFLHEVEDTNKASIHEFYRIQRLGREVVEWARGLQSAY